MEGALRRLEEQERRSRERDEEARQAREREETLKKEMAEERQKGAGVSTGRPGRLHLRPGRAWLIQASEISAGKAQAF